MTSNHKFDEFRESGFSRSRSRSPHDFAGKLHSPQRIIDNQRHNGRLLVNSNSFSNIKMQAQQQTPVQPSFAEYQANLKVTNKYAERFGLIDKPTAGLQTRNIHMHSFGNEIYP
jgi:hypothetical protein